MGEGIDESGFARLHGSYHNHHKGLAVHFLCTIQQKMHLCIKFGIPCDIGIVGNRFQSVAHPCRCLFEQLQTCIRDICHAIG